LLLDSFSRKDDTIFVILQFWYPSGVLVQLSLTLKQQL